MHLVPPAGRGSSNGAGGGIGPPSGAGGGSLGAAPIRPPPSFEDVLGAELEAPEAPRDWMESEPGFREFVDETRRLLRRAKRRMFVSILLTLLLVGGLVAKQKTSQRKYPAHIVLGVTENPRGTTGPVQSSSDLKNYVLYAIFTDASLTKVLERNHFQSAKLKVNPRLVLDDFREQVDVDVTKNEFAAPRYPGETRSALVAIELWLPDPQQAIDITRDLGDLVIQRDTDNQTERLRLERGVATDAVSLAQNDLDRIRREMAQSTLDEEDASATEKAELQVRVANLDRALLAATQRLADAQRERRDLDDVGADVGKSVALRWDRVDWGATAVRVDEHASLIEVAIGSLIFLFPLVLLGVGAFNPTIYDDRDVRWLGLTSLGVVRTPKSARGGGTGRFSKA